METATSVFQRTDRFDAVKTGTQPVDVKGAGMAVLGCQIERGLYFVKLGNQCILGTSIVDDEPSVSDRCRR